MFPTAKTFTRLNSNSYLIKLLNARLVSSSVRLIEIEQELKNMSMKKKKKLSNENDKSTNESVESKEDSIIKKNQPINLRIISNGYGGMTKSCVLMSDEKCYLINSGENLSRIFWHERLRIKKIENLFTTRSDWNYLNGINSITIELGDAKLPLKLHSPFDFNLSNYNKLNRCFFDKQCVVKQHDYNKTNIFEDENLRVRVIELLNNQDSSTTTSTNSASNNIKSTNKKTYSYLFTLKKPLPKVLKEKLSKYDIAPGPWIRILLSGKDYTLSDGTVIRAEECLDHSNVKEKNILFLDCNDEKHLEFIKSNELINQNDMLMIVHMGESKIINNDAYINWARNYLDKNCIHLYMDETYPSINLEKIYELQAQLNLINSNLYPLLFGQSNEFSKLVESNESKEKDLQRQFKIIFAKNNMSFKLRPEFGLDLDKIIKIDNKLYQSNIFDHYENNIKYNIDGLDENLKFKLNDLRKKIELAQHPAESSPNGEANKFQNSYPKVLFLGTSSASSTSTRNVTSILIKINESSSILTDCGEGTYCQLARFFGMEKFYEELTKIKVVFLSHIHLDHHHGFYGLAMKRYEAFKHLNLPYEKLNLMFPRYLIDHLYGIERISQSNLFDYVKLIPNEMFYPNFRLNQETKKNKYYKEPVNVGQKYLIEKFNYNECNQIKNDLKTLLDLKSLETVPVRHIPYSCALYLETNTSSINKPFKMVYSGDCRPSDTLTQIGKDCDLLIHECTFDNARLEEAIEKNHSTISEALDVSKKMNAKWTLLNHFSARYGLLGHVDDIDMTNVGFSFDFMYLNPDNLHLLNETNPLLKVLFKECIDENEIKREKFVNSKKHN